MEVFLNRASQERERGNYQEAKEWSDNAFILKWTLGKCDGCNSPFGKDDEGIETTDDRLLCLQCFRIAEQALRS